MLQMVTIVYEIMPCKNVVINWEIYDQPGERGVFLALDTPPAAGNYDWVGVEVNFLI